jgi:predicted PurR-regulated permease PerM
MQDRTESELRFLRRVLIVAAVVVVLLLVWTARQALLVGFAAVLFAILLDAAARQIGSRLGIGRRWALLAAGLLLVALLSAVGLLIGNQVVSQVGQLSEGLPAALRSLEARLGVDLPADIQAVPSGLIGTVAGFGRGLLDAGSAALLAVVAGAFLAADPARYRAGLIKLFPRSETERVADLLDTLATALRRWLLATLVAMVLIGVAAGLACWAIGLPSPLALGLFAGLAQFVPVVGAVVGAVPAVLLALSQGGAVLLWTVVAFVIIQQIESNLITPVVEERLVNIPPFLLLIGIMAAGLVLGTGGVVLGAPITVVAYVAVQKLYVRQTLGRTVEVAGEGG